VDKDYVVKLKESKFENNLYSRWHRIHSSQSCGEEFKTFTGFRAWAIEAGFENKGEYLRRHDERLPYSPENCYWYNIGESTDAVRAKQWNDTVNRIRKAYGMRPVEELTYEERWGIENG
jgi:hypothetical protein